MPSQPLAQHKKIEQEFLDAYALYSDAIMRFILLKISNRERSLDLVQETFMKTWVHMTKGEPIKNVKAFLYTVAGHLVIDEYRKRGKSEYKTDSLEELGENGFEPSENLTDSIVDTIDGAQVMELLQELPEIYRDVLLMKYGEEMTTSEIAEILEVTENVIFVRVNRGMIKLKEILAVKLQSFNT
jgi:RNA polymerase sigma-70 factor (ECF subfamily)